MTKYLLALAVCTVAVTYHFATQAAPTMVWELTTFSGELYIIGSGDTCHEAWTNHGPFPSDWRDVRCVLE